MSERTATLSELDHRYLWHPFTHQDEWLAAPPLIIERAEGVYLYDTEGRRYLDGVSSLWVNLHGHNRPEINRAIISQLERVAHSTLLGLTNVPAVELAARLASLAPGRLTRVFYSDTGACAVEIALKMAFQYWQNIGQRQRTKFLALENAYHGDTVGSMSVGGISLYYELYRPLLFEVLRAPSPYCYRCSLGLDRRTCGLACAEELGRLLAEHAEEIAAVIVEPIVQGAAGIIVAPPGYLRRVYQYCRRHGVLLICDEVATGFGRTGKMFACQHEGVEPDLMAVAKGITGGYLPLAATLATEEIFQAFRGELEKTLYHGHTYTGNPLACAAALASLDLLEKERTLDKLQPKIELLSRLLAPLAEHPHVGEVRQKGFMVGIELVADKSTRRLYPPEARTGHRVCMQVRGKGVIIRPLGDVVVLMPPLVTGEPELRHLVGAVGEAIDEICGRG
ncbi:MAG: adenosylmethionine--8-amino-7-oxononanoate transaminase [Moorellales bacterium]